MKLSKYLGLMSVLNAQTMAFSRSAFHKGAFSVNANSLKQETFFEKINIDNCTKVDVNLYLGNLVFLSGPPGVAQVRMQWDAEPELLPKVSIKNDTLCIASDSLKPLALGERKSAYVIEVTIPPTINITTHLKIGGSVYLDKLSGDIDIFMRAGEIRGVSHAHNAKIAMHAGRVYLRGLTGDAIISNKVGNIKVGFDVVHENSRISLGTTAGDIELYVPDNFMAISGHNTMKSGQLANSIGANIQVHTRLGKIMVANNARVSENASEKDNHHNLRRK